jgi:hypothetical protein
MPLMIALLAALAATFTPYYAYYPPTTAPHATHWFVYNDDPHLGTLDCLAELEGTTGPKDCLVSPAAAGWADVTQPGWASVYGPGWAR